MGEVVYMGKVYDKGGKTCGVNKKIIIKPVSFLSSPEGYDNVLYKLTDSDDKRELLGR